MEILLVDDDAVDRRIVRRGLSRAGDDLRVQVTEAETGAEALQRLEEQRFDCLLLDLGLPDYDGLELLSRLQEEASKVPVVVLTGADDVGTAVEAMRRGARDYLVKDVEGRYQQAVPAVLRRLQRLEQLQRDKRRTERELRVAESRYRSLVEQIPAITFAVTLEGPGQSLLLSPQAAELGLPPERFAGAPQRFWQRLSAAQPQQAQRAWTALLEQGEPLDLQFPFEAPDGRRLWLRTQARRVRAAGQSFVQGLVTDMTESHRIQAELVAHREQLEQLVAARTTALDEANRRLQDDIRRREQVERALFKEKQRAEVTLQAIGDAVLTLDASGRVDYVNPAAERLLLCSNTDIKGQPLTARIQLLAEDGGGPVALDELLRRDGQARYYRLRRPHGATLIVHTTPSPIRDAAGELLGLVLGLRDVTEERAETERLSFQARHDALTGLPNRAEFERRLEHALLNIEGNHHVLCVIDLDGFKSVNDSGGHAAGDELLRQLGRRLAAHMRQRDTVARLGGDEFGCLFEHCGLQQGLGLASELLEVVREYSLLWQGRSYRVGASIGVVAVDRRTADAAAAIRQADTALYAAKAGGRGRVELYQREAPGDQALAQDPWQQRLRDGLQDSGRLRLFQQPVVDLAGRQLPHHFEILLRYGDTGQWLPAAAFLPAAERLHLSSGLDQWVLRHLLEHMADQQAGGGQSPPTYFVNVAPASLQRDELPALVRELLWRHELDPARLVFELPEAALLHQFQETVDFSRAIRALGCRVSLDDYAMALPLTQQLRELAPAFVKIAGELVERIGRDPLAAVLIEAINRIGRCASIRTIAKWPRSHHDLESLQAVGVEHAQGELLAPPYPLQPSHQPHLGSG